MGFIQRRVLTAVLHVVAHPKLTLAVAAIGLIASVALAFTRLSTSTDQDKLFSGDVKFFRDYLDFDAKFPENQAIYVVIEAADPRRMPPVKRWTTLADAIAARLNAMPKYVHVAEAKVPLEQIGKQGLLFADPAQISQTFEEVKRFVPLVRMIGEKPNLVTGQLGRTPIARFMAAQSAYGALSGGKPDEEATAFVAEVAASWNAALEHPGQPPRAGGGLPNLAAIGADDPLQLGYFYVPDETDKSRHLLLVRVYHVENERLYNSLTAISEVVDAIRRATAEAATSYPEFVVGITGRPVLDADEMRITDHDSFWAEVVALCVVFVGLVVFLRSAWLALAAEICLGVGIGWTFGWATIAVGELNLLSLVFLIALIGIGMDYLIQILSRYRREAKRYARPKAIWARVFRYVGPPIGTACLGAAGAFFVAVFTRFKGAADLGIIAGGGLLLCLLSGYTVLPALLVLFPAKLNPLDPSTRYVPGPPPSGGFRMALPVIWIVTLLAGIPFMKRAHFNPNLLDLQAQNLESVKLVRKLQDWSAVVLSKDLAQLRLGRASVVKSPLVAGTESILSAYDNYAWLRAHRDETPSIEWAAPTAVEPADLPALAAQARGLADRFAAAGPNASAADRPLREFSKRLSVESPAHARAIAAQLSKWQEGFVAQLRDLFAQLSPPPPDIAALPPQLRSHLVSDDGTYALYIYPNEDLWQREPLARFVRAVEARMAQVPGAPDVTGIAPNIYHTTSAIQKSFYKATAYALALVFVLVLIDLRHLGHTLAAVSVLGLGLPMLVALMGLLDVSWNMANFFGLPILIGAGHEYGVFMIHRYREVLHNPRRSWRRWDVSDRALLLCGFVTSSSFGFFWALGHHEGLKSLGLVMALGTACIYLATIMVVRPLLRWHLQRTGVYGGPEAPISHPERSTGFPMSTSTSTPSSNGDGSERSMDHVSPTQ